MGKTNDHVIIDLLLYRIVFLFAAIVTPLITYLWKYQNADYASSQLMGWVMTTLFAAFCLGSFISEGFRKNIIFSVYALCLASTLSALYFAYVNNFNIEYTSLLLLTTICVSVILKRPLLLAYYYLIILVLMVAALYFSSKTFIKKDSLIIIFAIVFAISHLNTWLRYKAHKKLQSSEEQYRLLVTEMKQGLAVHEVICDEVGKVVAYRFLDVNDSFKNLTGLKNETIFRKTVFKIQSGTEGYWNEKYGHVAMTGEPLQYENYSRELDRYFEIVVYSPRYMQFAVIISDITERKKLETAQRVMMQEMEISKSAAETANIAKGQFLANMSHEIRTPLNGIVGFIELLSGMPLEREQASYLAEVKASSDALLLLINDILDYSKIEAGMLLIERIPFNLHRLVEEAVSLFSPKAHGKGIEIVSYIATGVPLGVQGDPGRLRQALNNIIGNAVKFTEKGEVAVIVKVLKESNEKVFLQIKIQDTGIGMSEETKGKLFQAFTQADASTTRKYEGTGLGLSISKKIIELIGGNIEVEGELDKGSTFTITFELEKWELEDDLQRLTLNKQNNLNNLTIMIVDDNESNRMIFREYLGETRCKVISAKDGLEGLEILKGLASESLPQIVLVDFMMPEMNGHEFGRQVLKEERFRDIRLILITSAAHKGDAKSAKDIGFSGYLSKPVRKKDLIAAILGAVVLEVPETRGNLVTRHSRVEEPSQVINSSILLVEDMLPNQRLGMIMLRKLGYSVELAINGQQAVELCNAKKFNLILMDCQMPVMDGYEATEQIKKTSIFNQNTPVIAMTAHAMEGDREKCIAAGMDDYISKPITMVVLKEKLGNA